MRGVSVTAAALLVAVAGCTQAGPDASGPTGDPPPVVLHLPDRDVALRPWTYCFGGVCADGGPPRHPESAGRLPQVPFSFALEGWEFLATFRSGNGPCHREISLPARATADGDFVVEPAGPAGRWYVDLSGRGEGGDVIVTFGWETPTDGPLPLEATGTASVLADHDGILDTYGVGVTLSDLDRSAVLAAADTATLTVTSAEGRALTIDLVRPLPRNRPCARSGVLGFRGDRADGRAATQLGEPPFEYVVDLTIGDTAYVGTGTWPDDSTEETTPSVPLAWEPPLPGYAG